MSQLKATPGPWSHDPCVTIAGEGHLPCVVDPFKLVIAQMLDDGHSEDECEANARLIAAAPELYEALNSLTKLQDERLKRDDLGAEQWFTEGDFTQARAALAKARGEVPAEQEASR